MVDDLTGKKLGRANSGTFRTADVVGLDTMAHVIKTMQDNLDRTIRSIAELRDAAVLAELVEQGALGQKTGAGFYKKVGKDILRFDPASGDYVAGGGKADEIVARILKKPAGRAPEAAARIEEPAGAVPVGDPARQLPLHRACIWRRSPTTRATSTSRCAGASAASEARSNSGRRPAGSRSRNGSRKTSTPARRCRARRCRVGVRRPGRRARRRAHARRLVERVAGSASSRRARLPVYERQAFRESVLGAGAPTPLKAGTEVFENDEVRVWTLDGEVLIASITAKMHLIGPAVIEGLLKAVELAESDVQGPRDLVARRRVLGRREPRGADAGLHEERRARASSRR